MLTNTSKRACTLYGYPGVSFVTGVGGSQVGKPATKNPAVPKAVVTLAPGAKADVLLAIHDAGAIPELPDHHRGLAADLPAWRLRQRVRAVQHPGVRKQIAVAHERHRGPGRRGQRLLLIAALHNCGSQGLKADGQSGAESVPGLGLEDQP